MTRNLSFLIDESIVRAGHPIYKISSSYFLWFCLPIRSLAFRISAAADYPCPLVVCSCDGLSYFLVAFYSTLRRINLAFRGSSCTTSFFRKLVEKMLISCLRQWSILHTLWSLKLSLGYEDILPHNDSLRSLKSESKFALQLSLLLPMTVATLQIWTNLGSIDSQRLLPSAFVS